MSQGARRSLLVLLGVLLLSGALAVASPAFAGKRAAKKCHSGGWKNYQTTEGQTFANQRECVKYVNKGGTLVTPPPTPTSSLTVKNLGLMPQPAPEAICPLTVYPDGCWTLEVNGFGLQPDGSTTIWFSYRGHELRDQGDWFNDPDGTTYVTMDFVCTGVNVEVAPPVYATALDASGEPIQSNILTEVPC